MHRNVCDIFNLHFAGFCQKYEQKDSQRHGQITTFRKALRQLPSFFVCWRLFQMNTKNRSNDNYPSAVRKINARNLYFVCLTAL